VKTTIRRSFAALMAVLVLAAAACETAERTQAASLLNQYRGQYGRAGLARSGDLDAKAQNHAQAMANAGRIYHSPNLAAGVSAGWRLIGENVAVAPNVGSAQQALEGSAPHRENMLNARFNQMGIGVVAKGGRVYLVQVFVQR
jgi:uncharacterized protein YkwD